MGKQNTNKRVDRNSAQESRLLTDKMKVGMVGVTVEVLSFWTNRVILTFRRSGRYSIHSSGQGCHGWKHKDWLGFGLGYVPYVVLLDVQVFESSQNATFWHGLTSTEFYILRSHTCCKKDTLYKHLRMNNGITGSYSCHFCTPLAGITELWREQGWFQCQNTQISQDSIPPWHPTCIVFLMARLEMFWTSIELVNLGDVGERYYRVWKICWSLGIYKKAIVWPINKVMYKQLQIGWHGVYFFRISHDINTARYLSKIYSNYQDPFRFQQRGNYTIPAFSTAVWGRKISKCFTSRAEASFSGTKVTLNFGSDNLGHGGPVSK